MSERLELEDPEFVERVANFNRLMAIPSFQEKFFDDPTGTAVRELGMSASESQISTTNQLVYRLLRDPKFNEWAEKFEHRVEKEIEQLRDADLADAAAVLKQQEIRDRLMQEFQDSVAEHLGEEVSGYAYVGRVGPGAQGDESVAIVPLTFIAVFVTVFLATGAQQTYSRASVPLTINRLTPGTAP